MEIKLKPDRLPPGQKCFDQRRQYRAPPLL
nr:MAG TPA: hypothetical protein [Caudoviricetes sp.]DAM54918.1 MAG TPA: hypothetical protein [Caudoviricetes sp.]